MKDASQISTYLVNMAQRAWVLLWSHEVQRFTFTHDFFFGILWNMSYCACWSSLSFTPCEGDCKLKFKHSKNVCQSSVTKMPCKCLRICLYYFWDHHPKENIKFINSHKNWEHFCRPPRSTNYGLRIIPYATKILQDKVW